MLTYRIGINLDEAGNPCGAYLQRWEEGTHVETVVSSERMYGPFDTVGELAQRMLAEVTRRWGLQSALFPS